MNIKQRVILKALSKAPKDGSVLRSLTETTHTNHYTAMRLLKEKGWIAADGVATSCRREKRWKITPKGKKALEEAK